MKALLLTAYRQLEIAEMPIPEVAENDVLVRIGACGICGSDVHGYDGKSGRRIPPIVMGHEAAGVVVDVGISVRRFQPGDRVTFDSTVSCDVCEHCRNGRMNLCDRRKVLGVSCDDYRCDGAFAEYIKVPQNIVYLIPDDLPFEQASMVEPLSVAAHAVSRAQIPSDATALVVGSGIIGLLVIQVLRHVGCRRIMAVDLLASRLALASQLGADIVFRADSAELMEAIRDATGGNGADIAFEAVGATPAVRTAVAGTRKGGQVVLIGNVSPAVDLPLQKVVTGELDLLGSCASNREYPACIDMLATGAIRVEPMISRVAPLAEGPLWFDRLYSGSPDLLKIILQPVRDLGDSL
ncbi:MAG: galactitol-1-phosphate 5-dehydrogenase [Pirellulales bacterium]|nr:galactitol-1-phosphate 5-dehydrogenase [Pirellulales bacterium]